MEASEIEERIREITERVANEHGLEHVHTEVGVLGRNAAVRIFIDKPGGVTHEDCATVSHHVGTVLDVEEWINSAYTLEVSSPGLERGLYKRADYERFAGQLAKMKSREAINGQRNFKGRLAGIEGETVLFDDNTNGRVRVPFGSIVKANLEIDVEEEFRIAAERERAAKQGGQS
ncbi:MAG TPA: ribosome maturation factor RimP [Pyrinomonadaceae bacterium]|nr:ribosome maturation factor RimP [Pyrinomonadaceae bacterium]